MGQMERNSYSVSEKDISLLAKATQVSDVAHGPLVILLPPHVATKCALGKAAIEAH
jgi:hypothetical protein